MIPFELAEPSSLSEAISLLDRDDPAVRPIAGGTALMLMMKAGLFRPVRLVSLRRIEARYRRIEVESDGALRIGAMATLSGLERSGPVRDHAPVIARTLRRVANVRVRNVATVGGNLAHADPHLDLPPVWIALGAHALIVGAGAEREIPVEDFFQGYYETALRHDEVIAELVVPSQRGRRAAYLKCTTRSADDWPALGIAVSLALDDGLVSDARVALGAATATPLRLHAAEGVLDGARPDAATLARAGEAAVAEAEIVGDDRGSAPYKKHLLRVFLARAVTLAIEAA
ncbi:MAG TPA: xanthine dehydrogenase family protein subunit M [Stellaceae bacterium]|nr:xanthine dehydrogenase family protein subunit M [Stellaceae bacterium]